VKSPPNLLRKTDAKAGKLENDLMIALHNKEFLLHYQPQVSLSNKKIIGAEALIRWNSGKRGFVYPDQFIPFAEQHEIIIKIGYEVIRMAFNDIKKLSKLFGNQFKISINLSSNELCHEEIIEFIKKLIIENDISPNRIIIEITERSLIKFFDETLKVLIELKKLGIQIALDDFGKGYSSLNYLCSMPIDLVKIDRTFIDGIENNNTKLTVVEGIITTTHKLHKRVLAEGIENSMQYEILKHMGCDDGQGFYFYKPMDFDKLKKLNLSDGYHP
jgi:EAL domain-containing protein (putative c-di-GMP-specific phosphodiesterase class I)